MSASVFYRWEAQHLLTGGTLSWGPSLFSELRRATYERPAHAATNLVAYGTGGQTYRLVRSDGEVVLYVEAGWRK